MPLQGGEVDIHVDKVREELESLMQYAVQFISLATMDYRSVWGIYFMHLYC
jgi:hypothetical protein